MRPTDSKFPFLVSHVVDLLPSFPKSGRNPKSELRVKSYGRFKFRLQFSAFCSTAAQPPALLQCVRTGLGFFLCVRIDIRASARILMYNLLYLFKIGARPEIHLNTYFGHITNRVSAMSSFLHFFHFLQVKTKQTQ